MDISENVNTAGKISLGAGEDGTQDSAIRAFMNRFIQTESGTPSIDELMEVIGRYFDADRSYIFEQDSTGRYSVNTYEWCAEGVTPEIQNLQKVPLSVLEPWWEEFRAKGSFYLSCDDEYAKQEPLVYEVLEPQGISSLIAAPFMLGGTIIGFLGVDNPKVHTEQQLFLSVAATMLNHELLIMKESRKEAERKAELQAALDLAGEKSAMLNEVQEIVGSALWKIEYNEAGDKETKAVFSDGFRHLFGFENEEDFPNSLEFMLSRVHPDDIGQMLKVIYDVIRSNDKNRNLIAYRYRAYKKDGSLRWFHVQGITKRREDGTAQLTYGVVLDVTDLEEAENGRKEALEAFESIHDAIGSANWQMTFNESGNMTSCIWSDRFRKMIGYYSEKDFPNELSSWTELLHPADKKMTLNAYWAAVNDRTGKTIYSVEYRLLTRTRGYRWYSAHGSLSRYADGTPKIFYGIFLDVNDQVLSAQSQEASIREITELNRQLEENQAELEASAAEQEAQMEEISALNAQLQDNQARLEESAAEQEAQMEAIQEEREKVAEAYGMIEGLSQDYHTIWVVSKDTSKMRLVRSSGKTTIKRAVQMGIDEPLFDPAFDTYISSCVEPEDRDRMHREIAFAEVVRHLSEHPDELYAVNYLRRDDSGHVSYHQIAFANADTQEGKKQFVYGFRDIDKIVKEEQRQKEELRKALDLAQDANNAMANAGYGMWHIILKDGAAPRMQVNDKMAELLGIAGQNLSEEELYNAWYDQIVPDAIPSVQKSVGEMLAGRFSENTYQWVHPTKGVIYVRCGGTAATLEDGTHILSGYHADVTDIVCEEQRHNEELRKAKEDAEAANAAKTSFLFNMSHDIRTPMNAIMGFRDLLERHQEDPEKRQDYLNKIQDASTVLLSIINNVLEMARIEKGTLEIDETAWSTEQFNDTLYSVFHVMMEEKGLNFTRQIEVQHHYVYCDPTKLREIFINILSNAYKYTNAGGSVNMHLEEIPSDRDGWVLYRTTITDTGIGMSEEFLPHLFEEFSREQNTTDAKVEGTGLGMPIVKRLVKMLDGTIEVRSEKGKGSTIIVTIPHRIADKTNLVDHAGVEIDPKLFEGKHILLAEDNDLNAEIAMEILGEAGFLVDRAEDGRICVDMLEKAEAGHYDLILMDIQMPNMNGYEATRAIRRLEDHDRANIKILAMTANAFEEDRREALKAGMNGHLAKPINVNELMKALASILN